MSDKEGSNSVKELSGVQEELVKKINAVVDKHGNDQRLELVGISKKLVFEGAQISNINEIPDSVNVRLRGGSDYSFAINWDDSGGLFLTGTSLEELAPSDFKLELIRMYSQILKNVDKLI